MSLESEIEDTLLIKGIFHMVHVLDERHDDTSKKLAADIKLEYDGLKHQYSERLREIINRNSPLYNSVIQNKR